MKKIFFVFIFSVAVLGFSQNAQASVSDGNWWDGCQSVTSKAMSFLSDKLGVKLAYAQSCSWTTAPVCSLASAYHRWYIDEASGTVVADAAQDNDGSKNGTAVGTTIIPGKFGNARNFNGTSDYVSLDSFYASNVGSVSLWVKPSGSNYSSFQTPISGYTYPSSVNLGVVFNNPSFCLGQLMIYLPNGAGSYQTVCSGQAYNATNFPSTQWTHIAITYDGTTVRFYKNGALISSVAQPTPTAPNTASFSIGRQGNYSSGYFSGGIDEIGLWRLVLTPAQILNLYNNNRSGLVVAKTTFSWPTYSFPYASICGPYYRLTIGPGGGSGGGTFAGLSGTSYTVNLYPSTLYSWTVDAMDYDPVVGICDYYTTPFFLTGPQPFTTPACACYDGKTDIGLRAQEGGVTVKYAAEPAGTSPLRVFKNGTNYGIVLVDPSDPNASKARVQTSSGVKAYCKLP